MLLNKNALKYPKNGEKMLQVAQCCFRLLGIGGGQRGIRTLGTRLWFAPLAGVWFQPTHPSVQKVKA